MKNFVASTLSGKMKVASLLEQSLLGLICFWMMMKVVCRKVA
jgi:hypothetical protein